MKALVEWLQSVTKAGARTTAGPDPQSDPENERETSLFHCRECETVYVAYEKSTCGTCKTTVEEVPAALHER